MGKADNSFLSGTSGRVGNVVVVNRGNQQIIRKRPKKASKPRTPKQLLIKQRFQIATLFISSYKHLAKQYYGNKTALKSCYNLAMGNVLQAIQCNMEQLSIHINYPQIQFAKGKGAIPLVTACYKINPNTIRLEWLNNAETSYQNLDQLLVLLAVDQNFHTPTIFLEIQASHSNLQYELPIPIPFQNQNLHVWLAFKQQNTTSNSEYLGVI